MTAPANAPVEAAIDNPALRAAIDDLIPAVVDVAPAAYAAARAALLATIAAEVERARAEAKADPAAVALLRRCATAMEKSAHDITPRESLLDLCDAIDALLARSAP